MVGSLIQWLRDNLQIIKSAKEAEELALTVRIAVFVPLKLTSFSG